MRLLSKLATGGAAAAAVAASIALAAPMAANAAPSNDTQVDVAASASTIDVTVHAPADAIFCLVPYIHSEVVAESIKEYAADDEVLLGQGWFATQPMWPDIYDFENRPTNETVMGGETRTFSAQDMNDGEYVVGVGCTYQEDQNAVAETRMTLVPVTVGTTPAPSSGSADLPFIFGS